MARSSHALVSHLACASLATVALAYTKLKVHVRKMLQLLAHWHGARMQTMIALHLLAILGRAWGEKTSSP